MRVDHKHGSAEQRIADLLAAWFRLVGRWPRAVVLVIAVLTIWLGLYASSHLGVNTDLDAMFSEQLPHRVLELEYERTFPMMSETVLVVIDGETAERASEAAQRLGDRMRAAPKLFRSVYVPGGDFFEEHALLYMTTDELEDFADHLARVQPYLAGLAKDGTLRGLANLLERGVAAVRDGEIEGAELTSILERTVRAVRAVLDGRRYRLSWAEVVAGRDLDVDAKRRFIIAQPVLDYDEMVAARKPLGALRLFARELGLDEAHGVRVRTTGDIALSYEEMQLVQRQATLAGIASFIAVSVLLLLALRYTRLVSSTLVTLLIGLIWAFAFAARAVGHLNMVSIAFPVLFIGLAVDFGIHFCMRYEELLVEGLEHEEALSETARSVGTSILLCALTTAIGFYAFVPTDFSGVAELGLIAGSGMFISVLMTFTLLPALISIGRPTGAAQRPVPAALRVVSIPTIATRRPRLVATAALAFALWAVLLMPRVHFDENPLRVRDPNAESVQVFEELLAGGGSSPWNVSVLADNLPAARQLAAKLTALPEVDQALTISDYVPADQDEKLSIMEDVSLFLAPIPSKDATSPPPVLNEQVAALASLRRELTHLTDVDADAGLMRAAHAVRGALGEFLLRVKEEPAEANHLVGELDRSLMASLPSQLQSLQRAVNAGPITLENLPAGLLERMVASGGAVRVEVSPAEDLRDNQALERFVSAVRRVAPRATGPAIGLYAQSQATVRALREALTSAVIVITILLLLIWRTVGDTLLVMTPLGLAALLTAGATVLLDLPFNFADVIVVPLLLGMGVDSGIHLVHRARMSDVERKRLLGTSTAHAILFSSLTTIASFASLGFASHRGIASLGQLLAVGVGLAVVSNLFVLPALIELRARRAAAKAAGER